MQGVLQLWLWKIPQTQPNQLQKHFDKILSQEPLNSEQIALFYRKIARKIVAVRTAKGISQLELSLAIGYKSVSLVAGAEAGYKIYILIQNNSTASLTLWKWIQESFLKMNNKSLSGKMRQFGKLALFKKELKSSLYKSYLRLDQQIFAIITQIFALNENERLV